MASWAARRFFPLKSGIVHDEVVPSGTELETAGATSRVTELCATGLSCTVAIDVGDALAPPQLVTRHDAATSRGQNGRATVLSTTTRRTIFGSLLSAAVIDVKRGPIAGRRLSSRAEAQVLRSRQKSIKVDHTAAGALWFCRNTSTDLVPRRRAVTPPPPPARGPRARSLPQARIPAAACRPLRV